MATATILPPARTVFVNSNGTPLVGGSVYFYVPNTTTPKTTWQDAGETIPNSNPIILDGNGSALIYGSGQYLEELYDANGNLIWTGLTQDILGLVIGNSLTVAQINAQAIPQNGSTVIASDGCPGSNPLQGSGVGCQAIVENGVWVGQEVQTVPISLGATSYTVVDGVNFVGVDPAATCTITLPNATNYVGRAIGFFLQANELVNSSTSNVLAITGGLSNTILEEGAGSWTNLVSTGSAWQIVGKSSVFGYALTVAQINGRPVPANGSSVAATDGCPGSNPLQGSGAGCIAVVEAGVWVGMPIQTAPISTGATSYTIIDGINYVGIDAAGTCTVTLPNASHYIGRTIEVLTQANQSVISSATNVVALTGGSTSSILAATAGKWATLVSNGTNWQIVSSN